MVPKVICLFITVKAQLTLPRPVYVGLVMIKLAMGQVSLLVLRVSALSIIHQLIYSLIN